MNRFLDVLAVGMIGLFVLAVVCAFGYIVFVEPVSAIGTVAVSCVFAWAGYRVLSWLDR